MSAPGIAVERCAPCASVRLPGRGFCPRCGGPVTADAVPGDGRVLSAAEARIAPLPSPTGATPFAVALVRLDAAPGLVVMATAPAAPAIGAAVRVRPLDAPDAAPYAFDPVDGGGGIG